MKERINIKKIITSIILILLITIPCITFASDLTNDINIGTNMIANLEEPGNAILGIVRVVGIVSSVAVLMVLGIKYMIGSVEEKAEYKRQLPIYLIGCILVFAISIFLEVIYNFINEVL